MKVTQQAAVERACDFLARAQAPQLPLWRAVADRRIALLHIAGPGAKWPARRIASITRPIVVLVGDDPPPGHDAALGPLGWRCAARLRRWCNWAMVHGAGGEHGHYSAAAQAAEMVGRVALVETSSHKANAWRDFIACPNTLLIVPRDGLPHPTVPAVMQ